MMIAGGGVCFVADACFAPEILRKHGIPFYVDVTQAAATLASLSRLDGSYAAFVPGHGEAVSSIGPWAEENAARLAEIRQAVIAEALHEATELGDILLQTTNRLKVAIESPVIYYLTQTTVLACLGALEASRRRRAGDREPAVLEAHRPEPVRHREHGNSCLANCCV